LPPQPIDQAWLDYQHRSACATAAGVRIAPTRPTPPTTSLRYVLALLVPITTTLKPFLTNGGVTPDEVEACTRLGSRPSCSS
jgi:hypothetical protein